MASGASSRSANRICAARRQRYRTLERHLAELRNRGRNGAALSPKACSRASGGLNRRSLMSMASEDANFARVLASYNTYR